jgi:hypothetical protein
MKRKKEIKTGKKEGIRGGIKMEGRKEERRKRRNK